MTAGEHGLRTMQVAGSPPVLVGLCVCGGWACEIQQRAGIDRAVTIVIGRFEQHQLDAGSTVEP